jgi:hypothetical protein
MIADGAGWVGLAPDELPPPPTDPHGDLSAIRAELEAAGTVDRETNLELRRLSEEERERAVVDAAISRANLAAQEAEATRPLTSDEQVAYRAIVEAARERLGLETLAETLDVIDPLSDGRGAVTAPTPAETARDEGAVSPEDDAPSGRNLSARFTSPADLVAQLPPATEWVLRPFVACGAITELVGRAKAAGKTTFLGYLMAAILDGRPFLGQPTLQGPIVLLTEQPPASLRAVLERTGLATRTDVRILLWRDARGASWAEIVAAAVAECVRIGARLLIVDTLPAFAGIRGDAENDAGAALAAIEPLQVAAAGGLAVVVVRHERKGGGDIGDSARGSSAFTGAVDIVLRLGRQENPVRPTIRTLAALSRFDETPPELLIELTDDGYVLLGDEAAVAFAEARCAIVDILLKAPAPGLTEDLIVGQVGGRKSTVGSALRALLSDGEVTRGGAGRRGSPYVYSRVPADSGIVSPAPTGRGGGRKQSGPLSVGDRTADILAPVDEPEDIDGPEDGQLVAALFADLDEDPAWVN